ncbi:MAG: sigma-70 family RNA polymerase sigma factor [Pseudomonadota bacterium]
MSDYTGRKGAYDLIERCVRLDSAAWEELVATHRAVVVRALAGVLGTQDAAVVQDLEQDTYERLLSRNCEALRAVESPAQLRALLRTIACNLARDYLRRMAVRRAHQQASASMPDELPPYPDEIYGRRLDLERIVKALDHVLEGPRAARDALVFRLFYLDGGSASEIASMNLGLSTKGVEAVLFRLVRKLRRYLGHDEGGAAVHDGG